MYAQQINLSLSNPWLKIPWVSSYKSPLLMSLELCRFPSPEAQVLYLSEKFPKVTLLWLCCQLTKICVSQETVISKSVGIHTSFCWSLRALSPSMPSALPKPSLCLCGDADETWGIEELVRWLAANEMGFVLHWEAHGSANRQPGAGWVKCAVGEVVIAQRLQCSLCYSFH